MHKDTEKPNLNMRAKTSQHIPD